MSEADVGKSRRKGPFERVLVTLNRWIVIAMMAVRSWWRIFSKPSLRTGRPLEQAPE